MTRAFPRLTRPLGDSQLTNAYLIGGGISSLAVAVHLIHDASVPPSQIHILESGSGHSLPARGSPETGYILGAEQMLNSSCLCLYDLLSIVPSLVVPTISLKQEIEDFNASPSRKTYANSRIVATLEGEPQILEAKNLGLRETDKLDIIKLLTTPEKKLNDSKVTDHFEEAFFRTDFWFMFILDLPRISTLEGLHHTPFNHYESIILPIRTYLDDKGVDFQPDTEVFRLSFAEGSDIEVDKIHFTNNLENGSYHVESPDVVFLDLDPTIVSDSFGSSQSSCLPSQSESSLSMFTVTLHNHEFLRLFEQWSSNSPGTGGLTKFKDSNWLLSIIIPNQPYFSKQPDNVDVFWGYALFPEKSGNIIQKPMVECTGEEILTEFMGLLNFPKDHILGNAIVVPHLAPYATSPLPTRTLQDRPQVIPEASANLALLGQFVEIPEDAVFAMEYSVRVAQTAVFRMMGLQKKPKDIFKGGRDIMTLIKALRALLV
ncbi:67 kDa myosin-cross-reactive antigen family protein [Rutstroemia sp. NJR-2017a WRK4]|nr:67 kDa myosin-cross-reactive antigen family protein [Rutstroemia sp. NJR-2017a WRK4]PQE11718.1 67 kDa myosin-cross-reactive antigen family protein [Rutstroemia sp. NJR-2017a WRK4]